MRILFLFLALLLCGCDDISFASPSVVSVARSQLGKGEIGGNNKGPYVRTYTKGHDVAWCAGFVSYSLRRAGRINDKRYLLSARSYWTTYSRRRVSRPIAGDIICFYRGGRGSQYGHVGIIESVRGKKIVTIEGNVGSYPSKVKRRYYVMGHIKNLLGFVRV